VITKDSTAEELCDILRKEGIDEGILEALKGKERFNGRMVVGASVNDVVVELQGFEIEGLNFATAKRIANILWNARDDSAVFAFPARVEYFETPRTIANPSSATEADVKDRVKQGSATIHNCALDGLICTMGNENVPANVTECANDILSSLARIGGKLDQLGFFGAHGPYAQELRESSLIVESLCRNLSTLDDDTELRWFHQLPDSIGGLMDVALYVSSPEENAPWIPVGIIEVGFRKKKNKEWQSQSYGINIAPQLMSVERGLMVAELLLDRNHSTKPSLTLRSLAPGRKWENLGGKLWSTTIWKSEEIERAALARVLWAFVKAAKSNLNLRKDFMRIGGNTCRDKKWVYKCYDYRGKDVKSDQRRSADLYFEYLSNVEKVVEAENVTLIRYPFIDGSHVASTVGQMVDVLQQLLKMHENGVCHGDVRAFNIVFGDKSTLIDFDFGGSRKKRYPEGYQSIPDGKRHESATAGSRLHASHDLFAFAEVMKLHSCLDNAKWEGAIHLVSQKGEDGLNKLKEMKRETKLVPTADFSALFNKSQYATGSPPRGQGKD